ncbi:hypothetical protein Poli38472_006724 [Pythium oligandrum]|uniref:Uncharacterized protein n=1 Tax=Pythium oligandrum TaxID=41045 RepID=A0A8K1FDB6_PYTOL|nr:hypothetical protein Poli38472_006724 [Pythium oligandrum]|eukprot:TMW56714.1 hypothetical protein Poli38472_006724 [Pythium oligandrum]
MTCSCGLLPCICVGSFEESADYELPVTSAASRLRSLVAENATTQCMSCMFLPCICPAEDEDEEYGADEATSVEATSPIGSEIERRDTDASSQEEDDDGAERDDFDRVRLPPANGNDSDVWIAREIKRHLRPHQVEGVRFMYENASANQGCILADYMGLGKTLQVITVIYSFMTDRLQQIEGKDGEEHALPSTMVLCPAICIPNWENEFKKWLKKDSLEHCPIFAFDATAGKGSVSSRIRLLQKWKHQGGVLLMGYEMYRSLLNPTVTASLDRDANIQICTRVGTSTMEITNSVSAKVQKTSREFCHLLCQPGADLVVLDEGHRLKDPASLLCQSVAKIESKRRLVLTGYPVQNSLSEYWCMVNFARDNFLGSYDAFRAHYERPIMEGHAERSKELISKLKEVVLRRGQALLKTQLPPKREWILYCKLAPIQHQLYCDFLNFYGETNTGRATADLLTAYAALLQVMNHPDIIHTKVLPGEDSNEDEAEASPSIADEGNGWGWESEDKLLERRQQAAEQLRKRRQKITDRQKSYEWARRTVLGTDRSVSRRRKQPGQDVVEDPAAYQTMILENSGKMAVLMGIIEESFALDDKVVVFSQSVPTLKVISDFLLASHLNPNHGGGAGASGTKSKEVPKTKRRKTADRAPKRDPAGLLRKKSAIKSTGKSGGSASDTPVTDQWFLQIDGSTTGAKRMEYIQAFSAPDNKVKLLLISTRAGAEGINLHAANRLVLFDVSWNPSNDHQSMCRSHRIGQAKTVHVYRLVSTGTMERMIYEQQMKKVDLSTSVVDDKSSRTGGQSTSLPTDTNSGAVVPFSGFLQPPEACDFNQVVHVDASILDGDEVLTKCVTKSGHWLVDVQPAHDDEEADDEAT